MKDPIADFKSNVVQSQPGETVVYHIGFLGADISSSPTLTNIQMFAYGLHLMGRVHLRQKRVQVSPDPALPVFKYEYTMVVVQRVHVVDFETARKAYLLSLKH